MKRLHIIFNNNLKPRANFIEIDYFSISRGIGTRVPRSRHQSRHHSLGQSRQLGHHASEVGQRVVVGVGVRLGGRRPRETRVVAAQRQRTRQQLRHHRVVRDQRHHRTELFRETLRKTTDLRSDT
jgi:hypothetical protein